MQGKEETNTRTLTEVTQCKTQGGDPGYQTSQPNFGEK